MIAKARSISHGSISIDYITRMGMAEIVKLNHLPKDVEVEAWWAHMQAHQMKFQYKRSKHRPMKNFMMRIEISPAREETEGFTCQGSLPGDSNTNRSSNILICISVPLML